MFSTTDERLHGVLPVLQTPFTPERQIDAACAATEQSTGHLIRAPMASSWQW